MSIQEIGGSGKERIPEYRNRSRKEPSENFQESLMQNLRYRGQAQEQEGRKKTGSETAYRIGQEKPGSEAHRLGQENAGGGAAYRIGQENADVGRLGASAGIRVGAAPGREAVQAAEVRHMRYEESDNIEIAVTEGYILKGKLEGEKVYVEAKYDDGRLEAYQVDAGRVQPQTHHRIERFAAETAAVRSHAEEV